MHQWKIIFNPAGLQKKQSVKTGKSMRIKEKSVPEIF